MRNLYQDPQLDALTGTVGIAHTRWATHGKPSKENSHPHLDSRGVFTVVHNGIIENYEDLRSELELEGCTFKSETDTEVIPNLIAHYYLQTKDRQRSAFCGLPSGRANGWRAAMPLRCCAAKRPTK